VVTYVQVSELFVQQANTCLLDSKKANFLNGYECP